MNTRAFDPALLDVDDELEETCFGTSCPICGAGDLVETDQLELVDLNGEPHQCPEV